MAQDLDFFLQKFIHYGSGLRFFYAKIYSQIFFRKNLFTMAQDLDFFCNNLFAMVQDLEFFSIFFPQGSVWNDRDNYLYRDRDRAGTQAKLPGPGFLFLF